MTRPVPDLRAALLMLAFASATAHASQDSGAGQHLALPDTPDTVATHSAPRLEVCDLPPPADTGPTAAAVARTACIEHKAWFQPFIDVDGRLASQTVTEAETARLLDDTPAWQRVARYWRESGTLSSMIHIAGARSCLYPAGGREADNDCRAYIVDNPWSAAFVSWVMARTPVPGFAGSARHVDYIARAWRDPEGSPYVHADPYAARAAPGDLLCFLRDGGQALGPQAFREALDSRWKRTPQRSHCDIVVAADVDGDRTLYLIGGNVFDTVTMRKLPLDAEGRLLASEVAIPIAIASAEDPPAAEPAGRKGKAKKARKPARTAKAAKKAQAPGPDAVQATMPAPASQETPPVADDCRPGNPAACNFNRRDWVVLLKLKPQAQLGGFAPEPAPVESPPPSIPLPPL